MNVPLVNNDKHGRCSCQSNTVCDAEKVTLESYGNNELIISEIDNNSKNNSSK